MIADERFWAKVDQSGDCWIWTGNKDRLGYGIVKRNNRRHYAHRHALFINGVDIAGRPVDHICHQPSCVNPDHLRCVTPKQNNENRGGAQANSVTGIRGVRWDRFAKSWMASVGHNGKQYRKRFPTIEEATEWARLKRLELFTHSDMDRVA